MLLQSIDNISAVFFDMDGTLVDSETLTEPAIRELCRENGIDEFDLDCTAFFGGPWDEIERQLKVEYPPLNGANGLATRLDEIYHEMLATANPPLIPMSTDSVIRANALVPTAIVSSSSRKSIELTMTRMDIIANINYYAGAEDYDNFKPAPDAYLKAASELNVPAGECLVFEDSIVGITAAKKAGMSVIAITHRCNDIAAASRLADGLIRDFAELDDGFFDRVCKK